MNTLKITNTLPELPESAKGITLKIQRANKHINDLGLLLHAFSAKKPHRIRLKKDAQTGEEVIYVERVDEVPVDVPVITGDAINNLRSALDHLAVRLYPGNPDDKIYFPIAKSRAAYYGSDFRRVVESFGSVVQKRLDRLEPYNGGHSFLWRLHKLNNIDKHRLLIPAASRYSMRSLLPEDRTRIIAGHPRVHPDFWDIVNWTSTGIQSKEPLKVGDELYRGRPLTLQEKKDLKFVFPVSFNEPNIPEHEPILETLWGFSKSVENVCRGFADLLK